MCNNKYIGNIGVIQANIDSDIEQYLENKCVVRCMSLIAAHVLVVFQILYCGKMFKRIYKLQNLNVI